MHEQRIAPSLKPERNKQEPCASTSKSNKIFQHLYNNQHKEPQPESSSFSFPDRKILRNLLLADTALIMPIEQGIRQNIAAFSRGYRTQKCFLLIPNSSMELTFLGNKYSKSETTSFRPTVQLKYMGKSYFAEQIKSFRNSVVLTYRGVSYSRV